MKCAELSVLVEKALALSSSPADARLMAGVAELNTLLRAHSAETVTALDKAVKKVTPLLSASQSNNNTAVDFLIRLVDLINEVGRPPVVKELKLLAEGLANHSGALPALTERLIELRAGNRRAERPRSRVAPPRIEIVNRYSRLLEEALGDDPGFSALLDKLSGDGELTTKELQEIAKKFSGASGSNRGNALKKISARHQAIMASRAKSAATGGRIAG